MPCPSCAAPTTTEMARRTTLGYRMFHCRTCRRTGNERTGTPFTLCWPLGSSVRFVGMYAACKRAEPVSYGDQQSERPRRPRVLTRKAPCSGNAAGTPAPRAPAVLRAWLTALTQDAVQLPYNSSEDWPWRRGKEDP